MVLVGPLPLQSYAPSDKFEYVPPAKREDRDEMRYPLANQLLFFVLNKS